MSITLADLPPGWQPLHKACGEDLYRELPRVTERVASIMAPGYGPGQAGQVAATALRNPGFEVAFDTSRGRGGGQAWVSPERLAASLALEVTP